MPGAGGAKVALQMRLRLQYRRGHAWVTVRGSTTRAGSPPGSAAPPRRDGADLHGHPAAPGARVRPAGRGPLPLARALGACCARPAKVTHAGHPGTAGADPARPRPRRAPSAEARPPRRRVAVAAAVAAVPSPAAGASARHPWATINICDPPAKPGAVGVRVFLPAAPGRHAVGAGAPGVLRRHRAASGAPVRSGGDGGWTRIGSGRRPVLGGTTVTFPVPAAGRRIVLRGLVAFQWRRGRRVLARARVRTTAGHADPADPSLRESPAGVRDRALKSRGSFVMTPVTPRRSSAAMRAASSTVHT